MKDIRPTIIHIIGNDEECKRITASMLAWRVAKKVLVPFYDDSVERVTNAQSLANIIQSSTCEISSWKAEGAQTVILDKWYDSKLIAAAAVFQPLSEVEKRITQDGFQCIIVNLDRSENASADEQNQAFCRASCFPSIFVDTRGLDLSQPPHRVIDTIVQTLNGAHELLF